MTETTAPPPVPAGPMPFTRLLDEAMRLVRRHFRAMYPSVAIPLALLAAVTGVLQALLMQSMTGDIGSLGQPAFTCGTYIVVLIQVFVMAVGFVALQKAAVDVTSGRPIDMKGSWRFAIQPPVLGTLMLQGLAFIGATLACFVPLLYVAPLLSLVGPIMAAENVFGGKALSRSAELTRYNPQNRFVETPLVKALGLMVVTLVISYALAFVVVLPFQIPMWLDLFKQAASGEEPGMGAMAKWFWIQIPSQILQMLATTAVYTYSSFGYALLFFDARNRKEGSDLAAEINTVFGPSGQGGPSGPRTPAGEPAP
jgi:hypothetical protein